MFGSIPVSVTSALSPARARGAGFPSTSKALQGEVGRARAGPKLVGGVKWGGPWELFSRCALQTRAHKTGDWQGLGEQSIPLPIPSLLADARRNLSRWQWCDVPLRPRCPDSQPTLLT